MIFFQIRWLVGSSKDVSELVRSCKTPLGMVQPEDVLSVRCMWHTLRMKQLTEVRINSTRVARWSRPKPILVIF
jgi:hypothetical protein